MSNSSKQTFSSLGKLAANILKSAAHSCEMSTQRLSKDASLSLDAREKYAEAANNLCSFQERFPLFQNEDGQHSDYYLEDPEAFREAYVREVQVREEAEVTERERNYKKASHSAIYERKMHRERRQQLRKQRHRHINHTIANSKED